MDEYRTAAVPVILKSKGVRVLLVDHYSSFSYNLLQLVAEITGIVPTVIYCDAAIPDDLSAFDCVVISPGPGSPENPSDIGSSRYFLQECELPVLGICLGHQALAYGFGATIARSEEPIHGQKWAIQHRGEHPLFTEIPNRFYAVRYHSLQIEAPLPKELVSLAETAEGTIMAIAHKELPKWGVQFHPESFETEHGRTLLANFCAMSIGREQLAERVDSAITRATATRTIDTEWTLLRHPLSHAGDATSLFSALFGKSEHCFWLDGKSCPRGMSYMGDGKGDNAHLLRYNNADKSLVRHSDAGETSVSVDCVFDYLAEALSGQRIQESEAGAEDGFRGGYVGYFGYELGRSAKYSSYAPDAQWLWVERFLAFDHRDNSASLVALVPAGDEEASAKAHRWFRAMESRCRDQGKIAHMEPEPRGIEQNLGLSLREGREAYEKKIAQCIEAIRAGESYELCLTTELSGHANVDALSLFFDTRQNNPAPYSAFLRCPEFSLVSASPERFLRIDSNGKVESKPIKGTAKRSPDAALDKKLAKSLVESDKERAENLMIVDLVRNDLGRNCEIGSVEVSSFAEVESYATVHQLVSTICGQLRPEVSPMHCVRDAFPAGSMTGAPKIRSMKILEELETGARGIYSGAMGYLGVNGSVELSVVIRSTFVSGDSLRIGVGGAITVLSDSAAEFEEVRLKAKASVEALQRTMVSKSGADVADS